MKTKISKYLIMAAVFMISLTAIYLIGSKNNNAKDNLSSEFKLSKKTGENIYFDVQNISVKYRDIEGNKEIERNLTEEEREKVINYFKNAEFKILEGKNRHNIIFTASLSFDNKFDIYFSPEVDGLYAVGSYPFQFKDESSEKKAYDIFKSLVLKYKEI